MKNKDEKKEKRPYCPACSMLDEILDELDADKDMEDENNADLKIEETKKK